jgi:hypothetical protein
MSDTRVKKTPSVKQGVKPLRVRALGYQTAADLRVRFPIYPAAGDPPSPLAAHLHSHLTQLRKKA